ncbi:GNAT family N-acetyltransferase [Mesoplasma chauliocola]|uniref:GNAT family N-acetyltransferase n=1 Tax=Mesoplasma chauliocola TaxID=216427 RepID=A0A249SP51_9MOLU|nr:GNAT family N-acetyltransferase [Mesoplasma chauliocola]ASZ09373.1 GNAT family N-acetyltransferase [Mesoplasma chauliocola]
MKIEFKKYDELNNKEIWEIFKNRSEVFVVEQEWLACDIDENDLIATHMMIKNQEDEIVAYLRIFKLDDQTITFGRVLTPIKFRGLSYGKDLLFNATKWIKANYPQMNIKISAQYRLLNFYKSFGFIEASDVYDDDGIEHIKMMIEFK